jgi:O-antigen/teichoic acid export membrane protein
MAGIVSPGYKRMTARPVVGIADDSAPGAVASGVGAADRGGARSALLSAQAILQNSAAIVCNSVVRRILAFVATVSIARYLPVDTFGRYVLVLATMELFRSVADFGIDQIAVRRLAQREGPGVLRSALRLKLATSLVAVACAQAFALALGYGPQLMGYLALASLTLLFNSVAVTLATHFQASLSVRRLVPVNGATSLLMLVLVWAGIALHVSVAGLLAVAAIAEACGLVMTYVLLRRAGPRIDAAQPSGLPMRQFFAEVAPLGLGNVLVMAYFRLDTIVLSKIGGDTQVGHYGAIFRLTEGSLALATGVAATFLPLLSAHLADQASRERALDLYERGFKVLLASAVLIASAITLLAGPIIRLLYGTRYEDAAPGLAVLIWSTVFMSINMLQASAFVALGRQRVFFVVKAAVLVINVTLILTLIPWIGLLGACVATVATEGANALIQNLLLARDLPLRRILLPVLRCGGLAVLVLGLYLSLDRSTLISAALGVAVVYYGATLIGMEIWTGVGLQARQRLLGAAAVAIKVGK